MSISFKPRTTHEEHLRIFLLLFLWFASNTYYPARRCSSILTYSIRIQISQNIWNELPKNFETPLILWSLRSYGKYFGIVLTCQPMRTSSQFRRLDERITFSAFLDYTKMTNSTWGVGCENKFILLLLLFSFSHFHKQPQQCNNKNT